jgi:peptidoglycan/xylan/chitin deacetylase (PgdA/CDA1 family)
MAGWRDIILMYHRVVPPEVALKSVQKGMYVEPATFESHLGYLTGLFDVIHLEDYRTRRGGAGDSPGGKPMCIMTFDDGWKDFYAYAYPILKANSVPATVFVATDFIGTDEWLWTDRLSHVLLGQASRGRSGRVSHSSSSPLVRRIEGLGTPSERTLEESIRILKEYPPEAIRETITELAVRTGADPGNPPGRAFLTWEEVRKMVASGLVSIGSHTASHRILTSLPEDEIRDEMARSRDRLIMEGAVSEKFLPFSYPNGNFNGKIAAMAREAGYSLAVTTEAGWNGRDSDLFALRRNAIHQDMASSTPLFGCRILNIL